MPDHLSSHDELRNTRRTFLKVAGLGGAVLVAGCDSDAPDPIDPGAFGMISGTVTNADDGSPVSGATVSVLDTSRSVTTGSDGTYTIEPLRAGDYTLVATGVNFQMSDEQEVTVTGDGTATADFMLVPGPMTVTLDFSNDFGVLNYAYALEQLEAAFYAAVVGSDTFASTFDADEQAIFEDLAAHEAIHRDFFATALGDNAIPALRPALDGVDLSDRSAVLAAAQTFEDLGVGAYNGAGQYLSDDTFLTLAGKIVSVEARHASVIAGLIEANSIAGDGVVDDDGLDQALAPGDVVAAANGFLFDMLEVTNVPA